MSQVPDERTKVEAPFIDQLRKLCWQYLPGGHRGALPDRAGVVPGGAAFSAGLRQMLCGGSMWTSAASLWLDEGAGRWKAVGQLERLGTHKLMEANQGATELLLKGVPVEGDPARVGRRPGPDDRLHRLGHPGAATTSWW